MLAFSSIPNRLPNPELSQCLPLKRTPDGRSPNFLPRKTNPLLKTEADHDSLFSVMAKPALGKGFDALINQNLSRESLATPQAGDVVHQLSHASIIPSSLQPRAIFTPEQLAELVDSIKEHGIIQPLIVRKTDDNKYELIAGERRWRASGILGLSTVPAIIRKATDKDVLELALIENLQRENLSPLEEAAGYMRLKAENEVKFAYAAGVFRHLTKYSR